MTTITPKYLRESQIRCEPHGILPMGRTKFRQLIAAGDLPKPAMLLGKCNYWLEADVLEAIELLAASSTSARPENFAGLKHVGGPR